MMNSTNTIEAEFSRSLTAGCGVQCKNTSRIRSPSQGRLMLHFQVTFLHNIWEKVGSNTGRDNDYSHYAAVWSPQFLQENYSVVTRMGTQLLLSENLLVHY